MTPDITNQLQYEPLNAADAQPDWAGQIPLDGQPSPQPEITDANGQPVRKDDMVQSPRTKRCYHVARVKPNGRLVLYNHGWPRIKNADPRNWRVVPRIPVGEVR